MELSRIYFSVYPLLFFTQKKSFPFFVRNRNFLLFYATEFQQEKIAENFKSSSWIIQHFYLLKWSKANPKQMRNFLVSYPICIIFYTEKILFIFCWQKKLFAFLRNRIPTGKDHRKLFKFLMNYSALIECFSQLSRMCKLSKGILSQFIY